MFTKYATKSGGANERERESKRLRRFVKLFFSVFLFIAFFHFAHTSTFAATYYVDSSVTDTNVASATPDFTTYNSATFATTGGSSSVYKTIADLNAKSFSAGDNIYFRRGQTWNEQLTISQSGTSGNQITFGAFGSGNKPIIDGQNTRSYAITTNAFNYITLQDLQIQNATWANFWSDVVSSGAVLTNIDSVGGVRGIWFRKPSNSTFTNITATNASSMCFQLGQLGTNVTINGITASGCSGYPGIYLNQLTNVTASNLTAIDNLVTGIMFQDITGTWNISDVISGGLNNGNTGAGIHILGAVAGNNANFNLDNVTSSYNTVEGFFLQNVRDGTVTGVIAIMDLNLILQRILQSKIRLVDITV